MWVVVNVFVGSVAVIVSSPQALLGTVATGVVGAVVAVDVCRPARLRDRVNVTN